MEEYPKLINIENNSTIIINNSVFSIGRSLSCNHIIESLGVSRFHCIIKKLGTKWALFDRSTNGTTVNGQLIKYNDSIPLKNGDVIKLPVTDKDIEFRFISTNDNNLEDIRLVDNLKRDGSTPTCSTTNTGVEIAIPTSSSNDYEKDELSSLQELAQEFQKPFDNNNPKSSGGGDDDKNEQKTPPMSQDSETVIKSEFCCSICSELYIKAITLNCSHTFCKYCIEEWKRNKTVCPICRAKMTTFVPTRVLDNFIDRIIAKSSDEERELRNEIIRNREEKTPLPGPSNVKQVRIIGEERVIVLSSEDDENEIDVDSEIETWSEDRYSSFYEEEISDDEDVEYNGIPGRFYGGYGRCYICGERGHWANGCPNVYR